jgi:hypothetical protein
VVEQRLRSGWAFFTRAGRVGLWLSAALACLAALGAPVRAAELRYSDRLFAKYHWTVERSERDGSASAFVICPGGELRFRVRAERAATLPGRLSYFELYVNGKFLTRLDRRGPIGLEEGTGLEPGEFTPWIEVKKPGRVRRGMNRVTLVYRGRMGPGDPEEPGPGVWAGEVGFGRCRLMDLLRLLKGLAQGAGWEAETWRTLQVFDGDLRSASRTVALDKLDDGLGRARSRSAELLADPETRRFYAEVDDSVYSRTAERLDLRRIWSRRLETLERLQSFWARSRLVRTAGWLYRKVECMQERLEDVAAARENLRNLYWVYAGKGYNSLTAERFESTLDLGRQNVEVLGDLLLQLDETRKQLAAARQAYGAKGRPAGSEDIRGPFELLEKGGQMRPAEYADVEKAAAAERELNLYLTLLGDYAKDDLAFLKLELRFLADLIGRQPPEPSPKRRPFHARPKWAK